MGVVWSMEVISYLIASDSPYFMLTDICNTLQGVLIFILFVLNRRVLGLVKERYVIDNIRYFIFDLIQINQFLLFMDLDGEIGVAKQFGMKIMHRIVLQPHMCD